MFAATLPSEDVSTPSYKIAPHELVPGLTYSQRADGIFVFSCTYMTSEVIQANFATAMANDRKAYEAKKHIRTLLNLHGNSYVNPHVITQSVLAARETPKDLRESIAIVGEGFSMKIMKSIVNRLPPKLSQSIMIFSDEASALVWLDKRLTYFVEEPFI